MRSITLEMRSIIHRIRMKLKSKKFRMKINKIQSWRLNQVRILQKYSNNKKLDRTYNKIQIQMIPKTPIKQRLIKQNLNKIIPPLCKNCNKIPLLKLTIPHFLTGTKKVQKWFLILQTTSKTKRRQVPLQKKYSPNFFPSPYAQTPQWPYSKNTVAPQNLRKPYLPPSKSKNKKFKSKD